VWQDVRILGVRNWRSAVSNREDSLANSEEDQGPHRAVVPMMISTWMCRRVLWLEVSRKHTAQAVTRLFVNCFLGLQLDPEEGGAVRSSETSIISYQITQHHTAEYSTLHSRHCKKLQNHTLHSAFCVCGWRRQPTGGSPRAWELLVGLTSPRLKNQRVKNCFTGPQTLRDFENMLFLWVV
jgi:hypothetical protein